MQGELTLRRTDGGVASLTLLLHGPSGYFHCIYKWRSIMEMLIKSIIPEAEMLFDMLPEELAGPLM